MMVMITHTKIIPSIPQLLRWYWNRWSKRIWKFSQEAVLLRDSEGPHPNPALIEERACWHPSWLKKVANLFESLHDTSRSQGVFVVCWSNQFIMVQCWFNGDKMVIQSLIPAIRFRPFNHESSMNDVRWLMIYNSSIIGSDLLLPHWLFTIFTIKDNLLISVKKYLK